MNDDSVFSTIFEGRKKGADTTRRRQSVQDPTNSDVIVPPAMRSSRKKKKSKYYTRPIFKEPGSKITPSLLNDDSEELDSSARSSRNRIGITHGLRDEVGKILDSAGGDAIEPLSRTQGRLRSILGTPSSSHFANEGGELLTRNIPRRSHWYSDSDNEGDFILEDRRMLLGYSMERNPSDISSIRREVKELANEVISPRNPAGIHTIPTTHEGESRDEVADMQGTQDNCIRGGENGERNAGAAGTSGSQQESPSDSWTDQAVCSCGWF